MVLYIRNTFRCDIYKRIILIRLVLCHFHTFGKVWIRLSKVAGTFCTLSNMGSRINT